MTRDLRHKLSDEETALLAGQAAELAQAGLPLDGGLRALADELPRGRLSRVLRELAGRLAAGSTLDAAIESQGTRFPAHVRELVLAAVRCGRLPEVLQEFSDLQRSKVELRRRVWLSLAYPTLLVVLMCAVFLFMQGFVAPQLDAVFRDFGADLPVLTKAFLWLTGPRAWFVVGAVLLPALLLGLACAVPRVAWMQRLVYAVPLIGPLLRWSRLTRFARLMGLLLAQRLPLPDALRLTAAGMDDADMEAGCRQAADDVESGLPLSESLVRGRQFPPSLIPLVEWGQRANLLPEAFRSAGEMFAGRTRNQGELMETVLLPLAFLVVAGFVCSFLVAFFAPLISMIQRLS
jgi:type II secretory pathway component PulF